MGIKVCAVYRARRGDERPVGDAEGRSRFISLVFFVSSGEKRPTRGQRPSARRCSSRRPGT